METRLILRFFWQHIKPYKWHYLLMLSAPFFASFYPFAYNYAIKLFIDALSVSDQITYKDILSPIILFLTAQILLDTVWRISNIAEWKSEPYIRQSILLKSYDYTQNHSYKFFQDNFTGAISSKLGGVLTGYDRFWAEMHHGVFPKILKTMVSFTALAFINFRLGMYVMLWALFYAPMMYKLSIKLNALAYEESESRHSLLGQISDKITNIISLFAYAARKNELKTLDAQIVNDFIPKQKRLYKYDFIIQLIGGVFYQVLFIFLLF